MSYIVCSAPEPGCLDTIFRKITLIRYDRGEGGSEAFVEGRRIQGKHRGTNHSASQSIEYALDRTAKPSYISLLRCSLPWSAEDCGHFP